jgi:RNA polymerase sigma-70 factor (ECF subfamily)
MFFKRTDIKQLEDQGVLDLFRSKGDMRCIDELYRRYGHLVYGVCLKYMKQTDLAKDMLFVVFEKLVVEIPKNQIDHFPAWLHTVTRNQCLSELRKHQKLEVHFSEMSHVQAPMLEEQDEKEALELRLEEMEKALEQLTGAQRDCVKFFYLENKSYKEIATETGYSLNEVKSHIQNGKRNMKLMLERTA